MRQPSKSGPGTLCRVIIDGSARHRPEKRFDCTAVKGNPGFPQELIFGGAEVFCPSQREVA